MLGLLIGSFLNVCISRLPQDLSVVSPRSHCPQCEHTIAWYDNIPVLSYLLLGGKCANCGAGISVRYPLVEAATGLLTLVLGFYFQVSPALLGAMLLTWALVTLTLIDLDHQLLPDDITLPLLWLGLLFNLGGTYVPLQDAVLGAMLGYLALWSVYWVFKLLTGKEGMGYGDFKLLAALGAWLGWASLPLIILLSSLVGAACGIALMLIKRRGKDIPIPFGPYLAAAGWIALVWGDAIMARYLGTVT